VFVRAEVLRVSPHPRIDVFTFAREATNAFWRGENPYAADYSNLYEGTNLDLGYSPGYNYFPTILLANVFSGRFAGDVRAAYVLAEALCAFFIWRFTRALGWSREAACALSLLWCANSLSFQIVEKWNDSIVLAAILGTLAFLAEKRFVLAGVAFGLAVGTKQYAPLAALPLAAWLWHCAPAGAFKRFVIASLIAAALLFVPFVVNKGDWLLARTILHFTRTPFREDSISLLNGLRMLFGVPVTSWSIRVAPWLGLLAGLAVAVMAVLRERTDATAGWSEQIHKLLLAVLCLWAGFFHTIKQSFLNYEYFYFSVAVLMLVTMIEPARTALPSAAE
jgi:hypothetical protein